MTKTELVENLGRIAQSGTSVTTHKEMGQHIYHSFHTTRRDTTQIIPFFRGVMIRIGLAPRPCCVPQVDGCGVLACVRLVEYLPPLYGNWHVCVCLVIGTKKFAEALKKGDADLNLIGQFGTSIHVQRNKYI